jgi:FKBP-type peptidyl-prolyl cis-trans isomerase FklB
MLKRLIAVFWVLFLAGHVYAGEKAELKTQKDRLSYSLGFDLGGNLKKQSLDIDPDILARGIKDAFTGEKALMTEEEIREALASLQKEIRAKQAEAMERLSKKNKEASEAFFSENGKKEGVITLPGGLQYKVITEGKGKRPQKTDTVTINYRGTLIDGTEFDSSYKHGKPAVFELGGVIPGFREAISLMNEGSKWQVFIPSDLAYGERGAGGVIGPNQALIFEIELISVQEGEKQAQ